MRPNKRLTLFHRQRPSLQILCFLLRKRRFPLLIESGLVSSTWTSLGGIPREQKMLKGHLPRVIYHRIQFSIQRLNTACPLGAPSLHEELPPTPLGATTVGLSLGPHGGPGGLAVSYARVTRVHLETTHTRAHTHTHTNTHTHTYTHTHTRWEAGARPLRTVFAHPLCLFSHTQPSTLRQVLVERHHEAGNEWKRWGSSQMADCSRTFQHTLNGL